MHQLERAEADPHREPAIRALDRIVRERVLNSKALVVREVATDVATDVVTQTVVTQVVTQTSAEDSAPCS